MPVGGVVARFALVSAAAEMGADLGILPWKPGEAEQAAAVPWSGRSPASIDDRP